MSTFTKPSAVVALTLAKDTDINDLADATEAAFALIPDEDQLARGTTNYVTAAGAGNAYTVSMPTTLGAYVDGYELVMKANHTNTGAATIDIDGLGAKSLRRQYGEPLAAGDIQSGKIVPFRYNTTSGYFEMQMITTGNMADVATVAGISGNVTTVAGVAANVTTVAGDTVNIGTVAANLTGVDTIGTVAGISADVSTVAGISANVTTVAGDTVNIGTVAANLTGANTIGTVAAIDGDVTTVAGISANVTTVAGNTANINTVAGISANITTVAGISANVTTVAGDTVNIGTIATDLNGANTIGTVSGIAADVSTVAGVAANVTTVAGDTVNIGTVAANLAGVDTIGTVAGISADVSTVAGISGNVTTVAGIHANVTTVAGIAANVTTVAGDSADIGTIATDLNGANTIGTVSGIAADVSTVAGISADVSTVAGISANVTTVAGISADVTAVAAIATEIQAANYFSRKNHIINGNFDIWQRGTSFSAAGYGADCWRVGGSNGSTLTHTQQTFTLGQTDVPNNPRYFSRIVVTSGGLAASFTMQTQRIEFVKTLSGVAATFSFYAKADAPKNMSVEFNQYFGTGGSPSATVTTIGVTKVALTTSLQKFTVTVALPSISGKTLGTNLNDYLGVNFWFDAGSDLDARTDSLGNQSGTFDIAQVQLEQGSVATTFEPRTYGEELALCQRYYWQGEASQRSGYRHVAAAISGCVAAIGSFPVEMRVAPTMAIVAAPTYSSCSNYGLAGTKTGFVHTVSTTGAAQYQVIGGVYSASAEL